MENNQRNIINDDEVNLGTIIRLLLMQSKMIVIIILLITSIGISNFLLATKIYQVNSLLQVYSENSPNFGQSIAFDLYSGDSNISDIRNIEDLYKSRSNLMEVINEMKATISIEGLSHDEKNALVNSVNPNNEETRNISYIDIKLRDDGFEILNNDQPIIFPYGKDILIDDTSVNINKVKELIGEEIEIKFTPKEKVFKDLAGDLIIESSVPSRSLYNLSKTGLVTISLVSNDLESAKKTLDFANNLFINSNIEVEAQQARKAIDFIDQRISKVENSLQNNKDKLQEFRELNKSVDVEREIDAIIESLGLINSQINDLDVRISSAKNNFTESNPFFKELIDQKVILTQQKLEVEEEIRSLPIAQQGYIDLYTTIELEEMAYTELVNRKLEFSIKEASTLGNIRIVDNAYLESVVSPRPISIFYAFFISIVIAGITAIFRGLFFLPVSNPAELEDNSIKIPIAGVLPKIEAANLEMEYLEDDRFQSSLESLILNIETFTNPDKKCQTIVITSPTASNGKSFCSRSVARQIASLGKKVLLMDCDMKRGDQNKSFGTEKISFNEFMDISENNIKKYEQSKNLYFISKIAKLENSFQFFYTDKFNEKYDFFKNFFDFIIIDTAPLLSVSDTAILLSKGDVNLCVCRHQLSKINEIKQCILIAEQVGVNFDGIVYNFYEKPNSYYGYYGLYGNYNYQYYSNKYLYQNYDYEKKDD